MHYPSRRLQSSAARYQLKQSIQATAHFMKIQALFIEFTAGIMHSPELIRELVCKISKFTESAIIPLSFSDQCTQVVNAR